MRVLSSPTRALSRASLKITKQIHTRAQHPSATSLVESLKEGEKPSESQSYDEEASSSRSPAIEGLEKILSRSLYRASRASSVTDPYTDHSDAHPRRWTNSSFRIAQEVFAALKAGKPVVALESTIYTHGFPYPDNISLALDLENIVRSCGAIPATIGILEGVARIGMTEEEIKTLASAAGKPETMKVSRRDLPYILGMAGRGKKLNGGTTVSGTMMLADRFGIKVFGTGGLGGVHRGAETTMDISADLTELGRTSVAVISSGCKSFLDIPKTLEYLETQGVSVCTFADGREGQVDFPAFYTRDSGIKSPMVITSAQDAAAIIRAQEKLNLPASGKSGLLFANPIPEEHAIPKSEIDAAINQAVKEAAEQGYHGHANTPFILSRIKELTKGNSIPANRALIESNVAMAAQVAVELSRLRNYTPAPLNGASEELIASFFKSDDQTQSQNETSPRADPQQTTSDVIVIGSVAIDLSCNYDGPATETKHDLKSGSPVSPQMHTSNIATIAPSVGGVGHNVALAAYRAGHHSVSLRTFVAKDFAGTSIVSALENEGLDTSGVVVLPTTGNAKGPSFDNRTAQYVAINDAEKNLVVAMADMGLFDNATSSPTRVERRLLMKNLLSRSTWVVIDANWNPLVLKRLLLKNWNQKAKNQTKIVFEPVSVPKASRIFESTSDSTKHWTVGAFPRHDIHLSTPNQYELAAMHAAAKNNGFFESQEWWEVIDALGIPSSGARDRFVSITNRKLTDEGIPLQTIQLLPYIPTILTKLGVEGVLLTELLKPGDERLTRQSEAPFILSRNSNGSSEVGGVYMRLFPAEVVQDIVSVNGVGDTFLGVLVAGLAQGLRLDEKLINIAQRAAAMTLRSKESVSPEVRQIGSELRAQRVEQDLADKLHAS